LSFLSSGSYSRDRSENSGSVGKGSNTKIHNRPPSAERSKTSEFGHQDLHSAGAEVLSRITNDQKGFAVKSDQNKEDSKVDICAPGKAGSEREKSFWDSDGTLTVRQLVPMASADAIMGSKGETIDYIKKKSGCNTVKMKRKKDNSCYVKLKGKIREVDYAKEMVEEVITSEYTPSNSLEKLRERRRIARSNSKADKGNQEKKKSNNAKATNRLFGLMQRKSKEILKKNVIKAHEEDQAKQDEEMAKLKNIFLAGNKVKVTQESETTAEKDRKECEATEKIAAEKLAAAKLAAEKAEKKRLAQKEEAAKEEAAKEEAAREKAAREKAAREKAAREKAAIDKVDAEKAKLAEKVERLKALKNAEEGKAKKAKTKLNDELMALKNKFAGSDDTKGGGLDRHQLREIEIKLTDFRENLEDKGVKDEEIEELVENERTRLKKIMGEMGGGKLDTERTKSMKTGAQGWDKRGEGERRGEPRNNPHGARPPAGHIYIWNLPHRVDRREILNCLASVYGRKNIGPITIKMNSNNYVTAFVEMVYDCAADAVQKGKFKFMDGAFNVRWSTRMNENGKREEGTREDRNRRGSRWGERKQGTGEDRSGKDSARELDLTGAKAVTKAPATQAAATQAVATQAMTQVALEKFKDIAEKMKGDDVPDVKEKNKRRRSESGGSNNSGGSDSDSESESDSESSRKKRKRRKKEKKEKKKKKKK